MAKKKAILSLEDRIIEFITEDGALVKLIKYNPNTMRVDINIYESDKKVKSTTIAFAHLPKAIKKVINPK
jgi:hypothetical protein